MDIDKKDMKILKAISSESKITVSDVCKQTGLKRDSVEYRLKKMKQNGCIERFKTIINPTALGLSNMTMVSIQLQNLTKEKEKIFRNFIISHPNITSIFQLAGSWDYMILVVSKDSNHFNSILKEIRTSYGTIIKEYEINSFIKSEKLFDLEPLL